LTKVGVKEVPPKSTIESLTKSLPLMVNSTWLPAVALVGEIEVMEGGCGHEQDTTVASPIRSTHKTDDLIAIFISVDLRQTGCDQPGDGKLRAIQEDRRG
jgi:hypothetical protein